MKIRPLNDWVLMKPLEPEDTSSGGIIIPDVAKEKPQKGIVEAVGTGAYEEEEDDKERKFVPTEVKPGDKVLYEQYMTSEFEIDGQEIIMVREKYILGILE